jgi:hypothetical protein
MAIRAADTTVPPRMRSHRTFGRMPRRGPIRQYGPIHRPDRMRRPDGTPPASRSRPDGTPPAGRSRTGTPPVGRSRSGAPPVGRSRSGAPPVGRSWPGGCSPPWRCRSHGGRSRSPNRGRRGGRHWSRLARSPWADGPAIHRPGPTADRIEIKPPHGYRRARSSPSPSPTTEASPNRSTPGPGRPSGGRLPRHAGPVAGGPSRSRPPAARGGPI